MIANFGEGDTGVLFLFYNFSRNLKLFQNKRLTKRKEIPSLLRVLNHV